MPELEPVFVRYVFGTAITPRGETLAELLARKSVKGAVRTVVAEKKEMNEAQNNKAALEKLVFLNQLSKLSALYKEAPFKSEAQRRKFYAMADRGEISKKTLKKWEDETPKGKDLPERKHKKAAGALGMAGMGMTFLGRKASTKAIGSGLFLSDYGVQAAKGTLPSVRAAESLKRHNIKSREMTGVGKAAADLIDLQKKAIEVHNHMPGSGDIPQDTAGEAPYVKKNSLKESSDRTAFPGVAPGLGTSVGISGPGSPSFSKMALIQPGIARWWKRGVPGIERETKAQGPEHLSQAGKAMTREPAAGTAPHIQSGNV